MKTVPLKSRIRQYWDDQAGEYDGARHREHGMKQKGHWQDLLRESLGTAPLKVLDVGTGTGAIALLLAEMGHEVSGIDLSSDMLEVGIRDAAIGGHAIDFRPGDAEKLDFPAASFDAVVSRHLLWTLPHPMTALREWKRVLRPRGTVVILDGDWSVPRTQGRTGSLEAYREFGIEDELPMQRLVRPAADVEMLERLDFTVTSKVLDLSGHAGSAMRHAKRFVVTGRLRG